MKLSDIITQKISQSFSEDQPTISNPNSQSTNPKSKQQKTELKRFGLKQVQNTYGVLTEMKQQPIINTSCQQCLQLKQQLTKYEKNLSDMQNEMNTKQLLIKNQNQQIQQLKIQDQYLLRTIQQLRDMSTNKSDKQELKTDKLSRQKQQEINHAKKQIVKLKQWLRQEKSEVFRYIQCVKIKDDIIENLETELDKIKSKKKSKKNFSATSSGCQEDQLTKFRRKARELQQQVYELTQEIDIMRNDNSMLKKRLSQVSFGYPSNVKNQLQSPILKLKQSLNMMSSQQLQTSSIFKQYESKKSKLLSSKCLQLQTQIEKLLFKLQQIRNENQKLKIFHREYSFAKIDKRPSQIIQEQRLYI